VIDVNLLGAWRTVRAPLPRVVQRRDQIVLISSIYAFTNGTFFSPSAASKAGIEQLGRAPRVELGSHGVISTAAYFGFVDTTPWCAPRSRRSAGPALSRADLPVPAQDLLRP
jgi:NAD(P)-dependent dehydrogenase (short-subunit alcohol dehydrogenase family)